MQISVADRVAEELGPDYTLGSGAKDSRALQAAVRQARVVFRQSEEVGYRLTVLDVGGGFQGDNFRVMTDAMMEAIQKEEFPADINVMAEPGRYYCRSAYTLTCEVIARRQRAEGANGIHPDMLYQNDGVYGNFMNVLIEREIMAPTLFPSGGPSSYTTGRRMGDHIYSIWGPTCDATDCVTAACTFKSEVKIGDWLSYRNMGGNYPPQLLSYGNISMEIDICSLHKRNFNKLQWLPKQSPRNIRL
jgi:ornithine decarboxylase